MYSFLLIFLIIQKVNSALLLWTPKPVLIPALKPFTYQDFAKLLDDLENPPVMAYKAPSLDSALKLRELLNNTNTVYLLRPDDDISENVEVQELNEETLFELDVANKSALIMLMVQEGFPRLKRKVDNNNITNEETLDESYLPKSEPPIEGPVLYTYVIEKKDEVMVYSSKPVSLMVEDVSIKLGNASMTFIDVRESYTRLIARIPTVNNRIIFLRFIFSMLGGYWYLNFIEVEINSIKYNLALTSNNVTAPYHMSYHCEDQTLFSDIQTNISLYLYDLQAQPDAHNHRFSDAYNCIPFTTAPILSGLFVTSIMCIGLAIGLMGLANIKTMDRFDNAKTKQLSITLFE